MAIIFRTDGAWGPGKGSLLTPVEVDENFYQLLTQITALDDAFVEQVNIAYITVSDNQLTFHMTDHSVLGPYTVPLASLWTYRGEWLPLTNYFTNDIFTAENALYLVLFDHTSATTFDPDAQDGNGHNVYSLLITAPPAVVQMWTFRGPWEPFTTYSTFDVVENDFVLYQVLRNHTSEATFDPNAGNVSGPYYSQIVDLKTDHELPVGGLEGQALLKHSDADYDVVWGDPTSIAVNGVPPHGLEGQYLAKHSDADYDSVWVTPPTTASKWYASAGAPTTTFNDTDMYLNTVTGDVYRQTSGSWGGVIGNIKGPQGTAGTNGTNGVNGLNGATWYNGTAVPIPGTPVAVNGDYYLRTTTGDYYQLQSGSWVLIGTITPTSIPTGGTTGQVLTKNSATNYDASWATLPNDLPTGGTTGQVLTKNSGTNYDTSWQTSSGGGGSQFWPPNNGSITAPPTIASSAWTSFGSGVTAEDFAAGSTNGIRIRATTTGGDNVCGIYKTQSYASDFTAIAGFRWRPFIHPGTGTINGGGLLFMTGSGTAGSFYGQYASAGIGRVKFTALTSGLTSVPAYSDLDISNAANYLIPREFWIKAVWTQSTGTFALYWSSDGNYWHFANSYNPSGSDGHTLTRIGLAMNTNGGGLGGLEYALDCAHLSIA